MKLSKKTSQKIAFFTLRALSILVVGILFWILSFIFVNGIGVINWSFLTTAAKERIRRGVIFPAIVGTFLLVVGGMVFAFPCGVMSTVYTYEYRRNGKFVNVRCLM